MFSCLGTWFLHVFRFLNHPPRRARQHLPIKNPLPFSNILVIKPRRLGQGECGCHRQDPALVITLDFPNF